MSELRTSCLQLHKAQVPYGVSPYGWSSRTHTDLDSWMCCCPIWIYGLVSYVCLRYVNRNPLSVGVRPFDISDNHGYTVVKIALLGQNSEQLKRTGVCGKAKPACLRVHLPRWRPVHSGLERWRSGVCIWQRSGLDSQYPHGGSQWSVTSGSGELTPSLTSMHTTYIHAEHSYSWSKWTH